MHGSITIYSEHVSCLFTRKGHSSCIPTDNIFITLSDVKINKYYHQHLCFGYFDMTMWPGVQQWQPNNKPVATVLSGLVPPSPLGGWLVTNLPSRTYDLHRDIIQKDQRFSGKFCSSFVG